MSKHTPGPWEAERIDNSKCVDIKCERGFFIATCHDGVRGGSNAIANARLIAAAPELLEALKHCEDVFMRHEINRVDGEQISELALSVIRAAIARATQ